MHLKSIAADSSKGLNLQISFSVKTPQKTLFKCRGQIVLDEVGKAVSLMKLVYFFK